MPEFALIDKYFHPLAAAFPGALDLRDDAAAFSIPSGHELIVTKDMIASGVHFVGDEPPVLIAQKALRVNLSDLAAKGAAPYAYSLGLGLPSGIGENWIASFADGLAQDQKQFGISLCGGDTVKTENDILISVTAYGLAPQGAMIRRANAKLGDTIFVTGSIGDAGLGLRILQNGATRLSKESRDFLVKRYHLPQPRLGLIAALRGENLVHAAIDLSDGLLSDLRHICAASGVGAEIMLDKMPQSDAAKEFLNKSSIESKELLAFGDDYEIVLTVPDGKLAMIQNVAQRLGIPVTPIGRIVKGGFRLLDGAGQEMKIEKFGFEHAV